MCAGPPGGRLWGVRVRNPNLRGSNDPNYTGAVRRVNSPLQRELGRQRLRCDWLAERLSVKPWTFSKIECGRQSPPADWYARAAAILGVPIEVVSPTPVVRASRSRQRREAA